MANSKNHRSWVGARLFLSAQFYVVCSRCKLTPKTWLFCHNPPKWLRTFLKRQGNFILCAQIFSHHTATHGNAPHRFRCFRKLPFKIHYKKMSTTRRAASRRIDVSRSLLGTMFGLSELTSFVLLWSHMKSLKTVGLLSSST